MKNWTKGWKAFDMVEGRTDAGACKDFLFEEGKTYKIKGDLKICENGFHACEDAVLCFQYYPSAKLFAEVEFLGDVEYEEPTKHKAATSEIKIIKFYSVDELNLDGYSNSGNYNSGYSNSGNRNSGGWNSGNYNSGYNNSGSYNSRGWNSGNYNSGSYNSGSWNACDRETGCFNTVQAETIRVFNEDCDRDLWDEAEKPDFIFFDLIEGKTYKESFQESFKSATKEDIELLKALPNFDSDVFYEISGIRLECEK